MENSHFIFSRLIKITKEYQKSRYLDQIITSFKKIYNENLSKYIKEIIAYNYPYLKEEGDD